MTTKHGLASLLAGIAMLAVTASLAITGPPRHPIRVEILITMGIEIPQSLLLRADRVVE